MSDPSREQFACPNCSRTVWLFAGERPGASCPHCGTGLNRRNSLVTQGCVDSETLAAARDDLSAQLMEALWIDLSALKPTRDALQTLPESVARELHVLLIDDHHGTLTLAVPQDVTIDTLERLRFILDTPVHLLIASDDDLQAAIDAAYGD